MVLSTLIEVRQALAARGAARSRGTMSQIDALEAIRKNAQLVPTMMKENLGVDLGFGSESVKWLDGYIDRNRQELDRDTSDKLVEIFGS